MATLRDPASGIGRITDAFCDVIPGDVEYICIPVDEITSRAPDRDNCAIGCHPSCQDAYNAVPWMGDATGYLSTGDRYLRPSAEQEARHADGRLRLITSRVGRPETHRLQPLVWYELAPCYEDGGIEHWPPANVCDCLAGPDTHRPRHIREGQADAVRYLATTWAAGDDAVVQCRQVGELGPLALRLMAGHLNQRVFAHLYTPYPTDVAQFQTAECARNMLIPCVAAKPPSPCTLFIGIPPDFDGYYNWEPHRTAVWMRLFVDFDSWIDDAMPRQHEAGAIAVCNAALRFAAEDARRGFSGELRMGQLDHLIGGDDVTAINRVLGHYERRFGQRESTDWGSMSRSAKFMTLRNCYLRHSGKRVEVEFYVITGALEVHLVLDTEAWPNADGANIEDLRRHGIWPHLRARLNLQIGAVARLVDDPVWQRTWVPGGDRSLVEILNQHTPWPTVMDGIDEIIYVDDDGHEFTPEQWVTWHGWIGPDSGSASWRDIGAETDHEYCSDADGNGFPFASDNRVCCATAMNLTPMDVRPQFGYQRGGMTLELHDGGACGGCDF